MDRCNERNEESGDARQLENVVDGCERPMILRGEHQMDEEDGDEGEYDASEHYLDWERPDEGWPVLEIWVRAILGTDEDELTSKRGSKDLLFEVDVGGDGERERGKRQQQRSQFHRIGSK